MIERACNMTDNSYYTIRYSNSGNKMSRYRIPGTDKFVSSKSLRKELDKIGMDYNEYFYKYTKILGTKPLIVWEMDYRRNPELIINKCVDFILGTSRL